MIKMVMRSDLINKSVNMKFNLVLFALISGFLSCNNNSETVVADKELHKTEITYDSLLAQSLGADDYGMKKYVMAFLKSGPNRSQSEDEAAKLQRAHLDNITRLANEGNLVLAGPFLEPESDIRGIYIFNTADIDIATSWTSSDPAIQSGRLIMELHPWYGSAALMKVNELHGQIAKINI